MTRPGTLKFLFFLMTCLTCVMGYHFILHCEAFNIRRFEITGNAVLTESMVIKQTGITRGANIFSINLSKLEKQLKAHPWIADATIRRRYPSKIRIWIREHKPLAVFSLPNRFVMDESGEIFKRSDETDPRSLPVVEGLRYTDIAKSKGKPRSSFKAVMNVLHQGIKRDGIVPNQWIETIQVDREIGITLHLRPEANLLGIQEIHLGFQPYSTQNRRLKQLLSYLEGGGSMGQISSLDLSDPDHVIVEPVEFPPPSTDKKGEV